MIKTSKNSKIEGKHNRPILIDVCFKENNSPKPVVIFCHGYKGFKDWGAWDLVAQEFANQDYFFIKFNFSHNGGTPEQPIDFPDLKAFGENNYTKELDDLAAVIDWIHQEQRYKNEMLLSNISLIGHSRGGGIVTIKATEDNRVNQVISWAGVSDYGVRFPSGEILEDWIKNGVAYIENGRTKQQMPHYIQFYHDFKENEARLTIKNACQNMTAKHCIIQGIQDEVVTVAEAEALHRWNPKSKLHKINGDHTFGAQHPWELDTLPDSLKEVVKKSIKFIHED